MSAHDWLVANMPWIAVNVLLPMSAVIWVLGRVRAWIEDR